MICSALCCLWIAHKNSAGFVRLTMDATKVQETKNAGGWILPLDLVSQEMPEWLISSRGPGRVWFRDWSTRSLRSHWAKSAPFTENLKIIPFHKRSSIIKYNWKIKLKLAHMLNFTLRFILISSRALRSLWFVISTRKTRAITDSLSVACSFCFSFLILTLDTISGYFN